MTLSGVRHIRTPAIAFLTILAAIGATSPLAAETARAQADAPGIRDEIRDEAGGKIKKFYASRNYRPLWASSGKFGATADALIGYMETSQADGLNPDSYEVDELRTALAEAKGGDKRSVARAEVMLSEAFARYVTDTRRRTNIGMTYLDKKLKPRKLRADAVLNAAVLTHSFGDYVSNMGWMSPHYVRLRKVMARSDATGAVRRRMELNLDRARILPGPWTHHIVVDSASGRLWYYQAGKQAGTMKVVAGMADTPTPMMAGMIQYAIINPYWNVPVDLAQKKIAPKVLKGRKLSTMGMEVLSDWSASPVKVDPSKVNWSAVALGDEEVRLRQRPGGMNSMGRVKFMFPNEDGIYLHDTPDRALFAKASRHFSNGCVRLEDAAGLGKWLMGKPLRAASRDPEQAVALPVPVPIYLTYFTASASGSGDVEFVKDVYRRDGT